MNPQKSVYPDDPNMYEWDWENDFFKTHPEHKPCPTKKATKQEILALIMLGNFDPDEEASEYIRNRRTKYTIVYTAGNNHRPIAFIMENEEIGMSVLNHKGFSPDWE